MRFICLGYADMTKFQLMSESELSQLMDSCFAYDQELRRAGHYVGGEALVDPRQAVTLRYAEGNLQQTDGPYAETREQIGGILLLEAQDMRQAVELMTRHPGVQVGPFEIRPADTAINAMIAERIMHTNLEA